MESSSGTLAHKAICPSTCLSLRKLPRATRNSIRLSIHALPSFIFPLPKGGQFSGKSSLGIANHCVFVSTSRCPNDASVLKAGCPSMKLSKLAWQTLCPRTLSCAFKVKTEPDLAKLLNWQVLQIKGL